MNREECDQLSLMDDTERAVKDREEWFHDADSSGADEKSSRSEAEASRRVVSFTDCC